MEDEFGNDYVKYPIKEIRHSHKSVLSAYSVVISFRKKTVKYELKFDTLFGLGSEFPTGEEYVFLREALYRQKCLYFVPKIILKHPVFSSGRQETSDDILSSRAALFYKFSGNLAFIKLFKLLDKGSKGYLKFEDFVLFFVSLPKREINARTNYMLRSNSLSSVTAMSTKSLAISEKNGSFGNSLKFNNSNH